MEKGADDLFFAAAGETGKNIADEKLASSDSSHDVDYPDGFIAPTEQEMETLRHVSDIVNWNTYLIAFVEMAERFSYYGSTAVWTNFIQQPLPDGSRTGAGGADGQSGALDKGQQTAFGLTTFNQFWTYMTPLVGAYVADSYWGRYKTICVAIAISIVGHVLLIVSSVPTVITKPDASVAVLALAMITMGAGTGGFKANISPLVAEQQRHLKPFVKTEKSGEKVIVDPTMTTARIYMYFYFFINVGALIGQITMTFAEKYVGFWLAFTLPTIVYLFCPIILIIGYKRYKKSPPSGSVLAKSLRLWIYGSRGRWTLNPIQLWKNMKADDFWESAKPSKTPLDQRPAWMTFDDAWVDEVRRGFKACSVFVWFPLYWLPYNQIVNNLTSQAATMETHGVPNDVINNLDPFALLILIPIFDMLLYPAFVRWGIRFTALKKVTWGFYTGSIAMIWAAVVQHYIYKRSPCGYHAGDDECDPAPLNVWIQTGSYIFIAVSEIFASITGLEYAFTKAPKNMKSLVTSVFLFTSAIAAALGEAFTSLATDPLLVWNYGVMAVLAAIGGVLFWITFASLDADEERLNNLADGQYDPGSK